LISNETGRKMLIELLHKSLTVVIPMIIKYLYFYDNAGNKLHKNLLSCWSFVGQHYLTSGSHRLSAKNKTFVVAGQQISKLKKLIRFEKIDVIVLN
jgi:hypothetical protein